jgi:hypothetical protein
MANQDEDDASALEKVEAVFKTARPGERSWDAWEVLEYHVRESACTPYFGSVDVAAATARGADFKKLLGRCCVLTLWRGRDPRPRFVKGIVFRVICRETGATSARLDFAPALWALRHGKNSRQFDNRTAPEVIEEVVKEGITRFGRKIRMQLTRPYRQRESLVQYRESDWSFVQRLMQDEGMALYFDQGTDEVNDTETLVVVDCNEAFPEVETMGEPEPAPPRIDVARRPESTWVGVTVIWDDTGEPVADLPVVIEPQGGDRSMVTTKPNGCARLEPVDMGRCEARCTFRGLTRDECVAFVGMGEGNGTARPLATNGQHRVARPRVRPKAIVQIEERRVRTGDTLESIARQVGLKAEELAFFNWGTRDREQVNEHLAAEVGCTRKDEEGAYVFDGSDGPGVILVPRQWKAPGLATCRTHVVRVRPVGVPFGLYIDRERNGVAGHRYRIFEGDKEIYSGLTDSNGWMTAPFEWSERYEFHFDEEPTAEGS